jgi:4-hydroxy-tetrahydrodipicolinate synthase
MHRAQLKQLIQGPIATVPTAFDERFELDLGRMADLTRWWVDEGLVAGTAVIKVAAAMGEGPDLSDDEWPHLLRTVAQASEGRAAIVCGLKTKNTLHTIDDVRRAADLGAIGVQIDLPIFHHPTQDDLVRYFSAISDGVDIGILIFNTFWFGVQSITADTMLRLRDAEHVVAVKWSVPPDQDYDEMRRFASIFNVIDNSLQPVRCHRNGGRGYINHTLQAYPRHDLHVWELLETGRYAEAQAELDRVNAPIAQFVEESSSRSGGYRVFKAMMSIMGKPVGDPRPPTLPLAPDEVDALRDLLERVGWPVSRAAVVA